ncbi:MAG: hypothetical protein PUB98_03610 [Clostridiales bacterium]|nr:hypothetical protein [Clostridiales bacterium]
MTTMLELKAKAIRFYGKNEVFLTPLIKFILAFVVFTLINGNIGYMSSISKMPVALMLALLCSILPINGTVVLSSGVILLHMYALSLEVCIVALLLFVVIYFLYFRFSPKNGYDVLLTVVCCRLHVPQVMPLGMGLLREIYAIFPLVCGTVVYYFLNGVKENATVLSGAAEAETSKIVVALNQLLGNREMLLMLSVMATTMLLVYVIRRMSIENSWMIAILSGILFEAIGMIAGYMLLEIPGKLAGVLLGSAVSCLIAFLLQFLFFNLDYSRTERLQFEDDEYYYYVKAVPKATVSGADKQIKRFGGKDEKKEHLAKRHPSKAR